MANYTFCMYRKYVPLPALGCLSNCGSLTSTFLGNAWQGMGNWSIAEFVLLEARPALMLPSPAS